jgi:hypothetical protein
MSDLIEWVVENKDEIVFRIHEIYPRIEEQIRYILAQGWATELSKKDFFHVHVCIPKDTQPSVVRNVKTLLNDVVLLYHTQEETNVNHDRNIVSFSLKTPVLVEPTERTPFGKYIPEKGVTVYAADLFCLQIAMVYFSQGVLGTLHFETKFTIFQNER